KGLSYPDAHRAGLEDPADWCWVCGEEFKGFVLSCTIFEVTGNLTSHRNIWAQFENGSVPFCSEFTCARARGEHCPRLPLTQGPERQWSLPAKSHYGRR